MKYTLETTISSTTDIHGDPTELAVVTNRLIVEIVGKKLKGIKVLGAVTRVFDKDGFYVTEY